MQGGTLTSVVEKERGCVPECAQVPSLSPHHPGLLSAWAGLAPTPGPGPHLELAPQVGHLIQPMLLYAPAAAPLPGVSAPFRFHLVEVDARCWGLASWGEGQEADLPPRLPQYGPEHQPLGDARQVETCRPSMTPAFSLPPGLSPTALSSRKPSQTTLSQTSAPASLSPLCSPLQPNLGGHCLRTGLTSCTGL